MADSISVIDYDAGPAKRIYSTGKLHKGHNVTAATTSIPTTFQTLVTKHSDRKGFNSQTRRFIYGQNDNPSPASYIGHTHVNAGSPSYSKRGTGGLASKDIRQFKFEDRLGPGPLDYTLPSTLLTRKDFNKSSTSRTFHQPIAIASADNAGKVKLGTPAPNSYLVKYTSSSQARNNNVAALAAFKSLSRRKLNIENSAAENPSPGHYDVKDKNLKVGVPGTTHCFKSTTNRKFPPNPEEGPGPGSYDPHASLQPVAKIVFPKKHYLCLSAPAMPLAEPPSSPGPGYYDVPSPNKDVQLSMPKIAFVSATSRWTRGEVKPEITPGPAYYRPAEHIRPSFIYNAIGRWI